MKMKISKYIIYVVLISTGMIACKNDVNDPSSKSDIDSAVEKKITNENKEDNLKNSMVNSVVSKLMFTEESKSFVRFLISADLIDHLSEEDGPFTILAPSNMAFDALTEVQLSTLQNYNEKELLTSIIKSHIINENLDSATLVQEIKKNRGELTLTTLSGAELKFSKENSQIIVTDENGTKAKIGKSDINGSNGVVHLLDAVLIMN